MALKNLQAVSFRWKNNLVLCYPNFLRHSYQSVFAKEQNSRTTSKSWKLSSSCRVRPLVSVLVYSFQSN